MHRLREQSGDKAVAPLRGSPESSRSRAGGARSQPRAGRQGAPHGPAPGGAPGDAGSGLGSQLGAGSGPQEKGLDRGKALGGTAGSVDNVFGDIKYDLGSSCAQVIQRLIKKKKKKLRNDGQGRKETQKWALKPKTQSSSAQHSHPFAGDCI